MRKSQQLIEQTKHQSEFTQDEVGGVSNFGRNENIFKGTPFSTLFSLSFYIIFFTEPYFLLLSPPRVSVFTPEPTILFFSELVCTGFS